MAPTSRIGLAGPEDSQWRDAQPKAASYWPSSSFTVQPVLRSGTQNPSLSLSLPLPAAWSITMFARLATLATSRATIPRFCHCRRKPSSFSGVQSSLAAGVPSSLSFGPHLASLKNSSQ